jgi:hypothetical protein
MATASIILTNTSFARPKEIYCFPLLAFRCCWEQSIIHGRFYGSTSMGYGDGIAWISLLRN